jgi:hypothetical protein
VDPDGIPAIPQHLAAVEMGEHITEDFPELDLEVIAAAESGLVVPDAGSPSPTEVRQASLIEHHVARELSVPYKPPKPHPDGYRDQKSDRMDAQFGTSQVLRRIYMINKQPRPKPP